MFKEAKTSPACYKAACGPEVRSLGGWGRGTHQLDGCMWWVWGEEGLAGAQASGSNSWADVRAAAVEGEGRDLGIGFGWLPLPVSRWMVISWACWRLGSVLKL